VEPVVDVVAVELRLVAVVPNVGRVRPHVVARHARFTSLPSRTLSADASTLCILYETHSFNMKVGFKK
jgi:hypothetical protein